MRPARRGRRSEPPRIAPFDWTWWTPYTTPFNLSQQPAIVLACGRSTSGLPIALQLVAPHHREAACIKAAAAYEAATAWHRDLAALLTGCGSAAQ